MNRTKKVLTIQVYRRTNGEGYIIMKDNHETGIKVGGPADEKTQAEIDQMLEELA